MKKEQTKKRVLKRLHSQLLHLLSQCAHAFLDGGDVRVDGAEIRGKIAVQLKQNKTKQQRSE